MDEKLRQRIFIVSTLLCFFAAFVSSAPSVKKSLLKVNLRRQNSEQEQNVKWTFCFERVCKCKGDVADCSQNYDGLTIIPKLPDVVRFVNFSFNNAKQLGPDFFANVTNITSLDISNNHLSVISVHAFEPMGNLTGLYIGGNSELSYKVLDPVFSVPTLETLDIAGGSLGPFPTYLFKKQRLANLKRLNLYGNYLRLDDLTNFSGSESLLELDLGYNDIDAMMTRAVLKVQTIRLSENSLSRFPETCTNGTSLYPSLTHLFLRQNKISSLEREVCLPSLQYLDLGQNSMSVLQKDGFRLGRFPSLKELYLDSMVTGIVRSETLAINKPSLKVLSLSDNKLNFDVPSVDPADFEGCPGLRVLFLGSNSFGMRDKQKTKRLFQAVPDLTQLHLQNVGSTGLDSQILSLISEFNNLFLLYISGNLIKNIPDGAFDDMPRLTSLDLSRNKLPYVQETAFNLTTRGRLQNLDLSGNPYKCSCEFRWLAAWLDYDPSLFNNSVTDIDCCCASSRITGSEEGQPFILNEQACIFSELTSVLFSEISAAILVFGLVSLLAIISGAHSSRQNPAVIHVENIAPEKLENRHFEYDLFVAYADGDSDWVRGFLIPELEERWGLCLCIHERDFHPGRQILDNIESCVRVSHKAMVVFSPHFARSDWCQFELTLCQRHAMDLGDSLVVVYLKDVPRRHLTGGMLAILRTTTYLKWSLHQALNDYFRYSLQKALYAVLGDRQN